MADEPADAAPKVAAIENSQSETSQPSGGASKASQNKRQEERDQDDSQEELKAYKPDEKKLEILRILSWPDWAYYEILEVEENASGIEIKKAFRKKSLLTHTDRNDDAQALMVSQSK
jgi:hypothetical protein